MTRQVTPWSAEAFEQKYARSEDPWNFKHSPYERNRYQETIGALQHNHYRSAVEFGCAIGELTALLAPRCKKLIALDVSPSAVRTARERCASFPHVEIRVEDLRAFTTTRAFDLIVFSEVGYYFSSSELHRITHQLEALLEEDGELLAVHWRGRSPDHRLHGDEVHQILAESARLTCHARRRHTMYTIEVFRKTKDLQK